MVEVDIKKKEDFKKNEGKKSLGGLSATVFFRHRAFALGQTVKIYL